MSYKEFAGKLNEISYKPRKRHRDGGSRVYFKPNATSHNDMRFQLQTIDGVKCDTAFGVINFDHRKVLELAIFDADLVKFLREFDEHNISTAIEHKEWFDEKCTEEQIRKMYCPLLTLDKSEYEAPLLHTTIGDRDRYVTVLKVSDEKGVRVLGEVSDIERDSECMVTCEATDLWFEGDQFGMSLFSTHITILPRKTYRVMGGFMEFAKLGRVMQNRPR